MVDKARDEADRVRSVADQVRSVADTERTVADHDRLEGDHTREAANTSAISDLSETIAELNKLLVVMATNIANYSVEMSASFRRMRWTMRTAAGGALAACVGVIVLLLGLQALGDIARTNRQTGEILIDCTTSTPAPTPDDPTPRPHKCYEQSVAATGAAVADLRRSFDCVGWYFQGLRPLACADVSERLDALGRGENPFVPATTTTTTRP